MIRQDNPPFKSGDLISSGFRRRIVSVVFKGNKGEWRMMISPYHWKAKEHIAMHCEETECEGWYKVA